MIPGTAELSGGVPLSGFANKQVVLPGSEKPWLPETRDTISQGWGCLDSRQALPPLPPLPVWVLLQPLVKYQE